jgi:hypothetical protein
MLNPPSSNNIKASKAWSLRALQLADQALNETIPDDKIQATCERARIVTEFNLGMLSEVSNTIGFQLPKLTNDADGGRCASGCSVPPTCANACAVCWVQGCCTGGDGFTTEIAAAREDG